MISMLLHNNHDPLRHASSNFYPFVVAHSVVDGHLFKSELKRLAVSSWYQDRPADARILSITAAKSSLPKPRPFADLYHSKTESSEKRRKSHATVRIVAMSHAVARHSGRLRTYHSLHLIHPY